MNRAQFLTAILAPLALLFRRKAKKQIEFSIKSYDRNALIKYPMTPDQCYSIGVVDPIGPPYGPYVVWEHDPGGPLAFKKIGEITVEKGKLVWTKKYP